MITETPVLDRLSRKTRTGPKFIVRGDNHQYWWILVAANGFRVAESSRLFRDRQTCRDAIKRVKELVKEAPIERYKDTNI